MAQATIRDPRDPMKRKPVVLDSTGRYTGGVPAGWSDYELEPAQDSQRFSQPTVKEDYTRDEDGYTNKLINPLDEWKNQTSFLDTTREIIKRKQGFNKDINTQQKSLESLYRTTEPFGSAGQKIASENAGLPSSFSDERLKLLSPGEQASVRNARDSAILGHLGGLEKEREYRGTRVDDVIDSLTDMMAEKDKLAQDEINNYSKMLDIAKKKKDLGLELTDKDWEALGKEGVVNGNIGGSVSWRNNNPLNIKYGEFAKGYGATSSTGATDGGNFALFPDYETGLKAAKDLLQSKNYKDLSLDAALKRWSNSGYDSKALFDMAQQSYSWGNKTTGEMNSKELDELIGLMKQREGWKEGTQVASTTGNAHTLYTKAQVQNIAKAIGENATDMWNNMSDTEISEAYRTGMKPNAVNQLLEVLPRSFLVKYQIDEEAAKFFIESWQQGTPISELKAIAFSSGFDANLVDELFDTLDIIIDVDSGATLGTK